ncbi:MAG: hypothetical protein ACFKPT_31650 [Gloeotrichia echinulata GP01]
MMSSRLCQLSKNITRSFYLLGLVSVANFIAAPANADQAVARGAVTLVSPSGAYQSISGEVFLPSGMYFNSGNNPTLIVTPTFSNTGTTNERISSLSLRVGQATEIITNNATSLLSKTAQTVNNTTTIENTSALIQSITGDQKPLGPME